MTTNDRAQELIDSDDVLAEQEHVYEKLMQFTNDDTSNTSSLLWQLISSFSIGMDITAITCPAFLLRPISMLEICSEAVKPLDDLTTISQLEDPRQRIEKVVKSYLHCCTLMPKQNNFNHCKPYNPIYAERFNCTWKHGDDSETKFFSEQVSHHPPISACYMINEKANFTTQFVTKPGTYFRGNYAEVDMVGEARLTLTDLQEEYTITIPTVYVCGVVWGTSRIEHGNSFEIECKKTGYKVKIDFTSGTSVRGKITENDKEVGSFNGDVFKTINLNTGDVLYDYATVQIPKKIIKPLVEQDPMESRRVWHRSTYALINGQHEECHKAKSEVEEYQRYLRKNGELPELKWFKATGEESSKGVPEYDYIGPRK